MFFEVKKIGEVIHPLNSDAKAIGYETQLSPETRQESLISMEIEKKTLPASVV